MYRSPNETNDEFEALCNKLQDTIDQIKDAKPHYQAILIVDQLSFGQAILIRRLRHLLFT